MRRLLCPALMLLLVHTLEAQELKTTLARSEVAADHNRSAFVRLQDPSRFHFRWPSGFMEQGRHATFLPNLPAEAGIAMQERSMAGTVLNRAVRRPGSLHTPTNSSSRIYRCDTAVVSSRVSGERRYVFTYDAQGVPTNALIQDVLSGGVTNTVGRETLTSTAGGLTYTSQSWLGGVWVNTGQNVYTYDAHGNKLSEETLKWEGGGWTHSEFDTYSYDAGDNLLSGLYQTWSLTLNDWTNVSQFTCTYDAEGNELSRIAQVWSNGWMNSSRDTDTFNGEDEETILRQSWDGQQWVNEGLSTATGYVGTVTDTVVIVNQDWSGSSWKNQSLTIVVADKQKNVDSYQMQSWADTLWVNAWLITYTRDAAGNTLLESYYSWGVQGWASAEIGFAVYGGILPFYRSGYELRQSFVAFDITGVDGTDYDQKRSFSLLQNFPNPCNPSTIIAYTIPGDVEKGGRGERVRLSVYDLLGREVAVLIDGYQSSGEHRVQFDGQHLASGVYYVRLATANAARTRAITLMR